MLASGKLKVSPGAVSGDGYDPEMEKEKLALEKQKWEAEMTLLSPFLSPSAINLMRRRSFDIFSAAAVGPHFFPWLRKRMDRKKCAIGDNAMKD